MHALVELAGGLSALLLALMTAVVTYEIVMRYVFGRPTLWAHDVSVYALLWFAFLGLAPAERGGHHIRVDLFYRRLPPAARRWTGLGMHLLLAAFAALATWSGAEMVAQSVRFGRSSLSLLAVPMWVPQLSLPVGMALLTVEFLRQAWHDLLGTGGEPR